jgi:hypothetical protein
MRIPREVKVYFIAVALIFLSFVTMYHEMVRMHEVAHQEAFQYFGINSTVVFYSPFEAQTIVTSSNLTAENSRFLYFIQSLNEVFEYQFLAEMAFIFLAMLIIVTTVFILVAPKKQEES